MSTGPGHMIVAPDETYSAAEAATLLERSERQVSRYLKSGRLRGSRASGRWTVTALQIWQFRGIAEEMLANWRSYCRPENGDDGNPNKYQCLTNSGE